MDRGHSVGLLFHVAPHYGITPHYASISPHFLSLPFYFEHVFDSKAAPPAPLPRRTGAGSGEESALPLDASAVERRSRKDEGFAPGCEPNGRVENDT